MGCNPFGCRPCIVDRCGELGFGSKAIVDRNDDTVGLRRNRATAMVVRFEITNDPTAAVEEHRHGKASVVTWSIDANRNVATRTRNGAIGDARQFNRARHSRHAHALTQFFWGCPFERKAGIGHEIENELCLRIKCHVSSP